MKGSDKSIKDWFIGKGHYVEKSMKKLVAVNRSGAGIHVIAAAHACGLRRLSADAAWVQRPILGSYECMGLHDF